MNYSVIAQNIKSKIETFLNQLSILEQINFDEVWFGDAHDKQISELKQSFILLNEQKDNAINLTKALELLQTYKDNVDTIKSLQVKLNSLADNDASNILNFKSKIETLQNSNINLKNSIIEIIYSITGEESQIELINYQVVDDYKEYIVNLAELLNKINSGDLSKISDSKSLYDYYNREELLANIDDIKSQYTGRNAVVNCALGVIDMAASVNKKINYELRRGSNSLLSTDELVTGTDCCTFAAWALSQGTNQVTKTFNTEEFNNLGTKIDYSSAQKGDIFTLKYSGSGGHVMVVIDNAPEAGRALVAEAKDDGVVLTNISYDTLEKYKYQARDLSSIY